MTSTVRKLCEFAVFFKRDTVDRFKKSPPYVINYEFLVQEPTKLFYK